MAFQQVASMEHCLDCQGINIESQLMLEGPLLLLKLRYIVYTDVCNAHKGTDASDIGPGFHFLDDDAEPPSDTLLYGLALASSDGGNSFGVVYFLILEEVERENGLTMKRIGFGITSTDEWAQKMLKAPATNVRII